MDRSWSTSISMRLRELRDKLRRGREGRKVSLVSRLLMRMVGLCLRTGRVRCRAALRWMLRMNVKEQRYDGRYGRGYKGTIEYGTEVTVLWLKIRRYDRRYD